jgi:glycosyltransferase involved in cell wall biosynthesis
MGPRVLFVNGGILGLLSFHHYLQQMLPTQSAISWQQIVLTEGLTYGERAIRRLLGARFWKDGLFGVSNLDAARFRLEASAGLIARRRIGRARPFDVLHFHRTATAYGSLGVMRTVPSIVSLDCTQQCVIQTAPTALERATYAPNVRMDGAIFRRAAALVATSRWAADSVRRYYPGCRTPIHVLPSPVLVDAFDAEWIEQRRARAAQGLKPRLLFVGGDFPRKGGYDLLDAWEAGGFHARAALDLVTDWHIDRPLPPGVHQHRNVRSHTPGWAGRCAAADIFVLPTRNEAFGLAFEEAAAAGLAAIGTTNNAVPEIIAHGETGLLVPPGDTEALARAMDQLIASPALRDALGRRARAVIVETASPDRYLAALIGLILDVAKTR